MALLDLPDEIVVHISSFLLDTRSLYSFALTSHSIRSALFSNPDRASRELLQPLYIHLYGPPSPTASPAEPVLDPLVLLRARHTHDARQRRRALIIRNLLLRSQLEAARIELKDIARAFDRESERQSTLLSQVAEVRRRLTLDHTTKTQLWNPRVIQRGFDRVLQQESVTVAPDEALRSLEQELTGSRQEAKAQRASMQRAARTVQDLEAQCAAVEVQLAPFLPPIGGVGAGAGPGLRGNPPVAESVVVRGGGQIPARMLAQRPPQQPQREEERRGKVMVSGAGRQAPESSRAPGAKNTVGIVSEPARTGSARIEGSLLQRIAARAAESRPCKDA